jgi:hypothetical protein
VYVGRVPLFALLPRRGILGNPLTGSKGFSAATQGVRLEKFIEKWATLEKFIEKMGNFAQVEALLL